MLSVYLINKLSDNDYFCLGTANSSKCIQSNDVFSLSSMRMVEEDEGSTKMRGFGVAMVGSI